MWWNKLLEQFWETQNLGLSMLGHHTSWLSLATVDYLWSAIPTMKFVHLQTILSRRHSGKRKFSQNKGFPTVKGFTKRQSIRQRLATSQLITLSVLKISGSSNDLFLKNAKTKRNVQR